VNTTILLFTVPPIAGALIGFVTNVIAIRMLFRPLKEVRIFGIKVPFTPGILPRHRHKLAKSIGAMVERELLTPEVVRMRLNNKETSEKLRAAVSEFTGDILAKAPSDLAAGNEAYFAGKIAGEAEKLYPAAAAAFIKFLQCGEIRSELESRGKVFLNSVILKMNVFQRIFISAGQYDSTLARKMPEIIDELTASAEKLLKDSKVKERLISAASAAIEKFIGDNEKKIGDLFNIGEEDKKKLDDFIFQKLMSIADGQIENLLASIDVKTLVSERIDSLEMLRVERIILDVMADQFIWIDIFGGILGFLIGAFQALLTYFLRHAS